MKRLNVILSAVLLGVCGWVIRIYPWLPYSPIRGRYAPGVDFATWYTLQHGVLPGILPSATYTSNLTNGTVYLGEFGRVLLNAPLLLVVGKSGLIDSLTFYAQIPWQGLILLPSVLVLGVHAMIRTETERVGPRTRVIGYLLTYALTALGFPSLINSTSNSGFTDYYGFVFVGLVFYSLVRRASTRASRTKFSGLLVLFMGQILVYHHTTALFLVLLLFGVYMVQTRIVFRKAIIEPKIVEASIVVVYVVLLIAYVAYLSFSFHGYLFSLTSSLGNLAQGILGSSVVTPLARIATTNYFTQERALIRSADLGLTIIVLAYIGVAFVKRRAIGLSGFALAGFGLGAGLAGAFVIGWGGFGAFFIRISALSAVIAILGIGYILRHAGAIVKRALVLMSIAVVVVSPIAYVSSQAAPQGALRWSEASAIEWTSTNVNRDATVMSDSRVASPLIYYGFTSALGFEDETASPTSQAKLAEAYFELYRPASSDQVVRGICAVEAVSGTNVKYFVYSTYFQDPGTSVIGFLNSYPPAGQNATSMLDNATTFQKIFDSGTTMVYGTSDATRSC